MTIDSVAAEVSKPFIWPAFLSILSAVLGWPQSASSQVPVKVSGYTENVERQTVVSGAEVVAVMAGSQLVAADAKSFTVWLPSQRHEMLCLAALSIDGVYTSHAAFNIGTAAPGPHVIPFSTAKPEFATYGKGELILQGRVGQRCDDATGLPLVPLAWGSHKEPRGSITLYANSDRLTALVFLKPASPSQVVESVACKSIPASHPTRVFSHVCPIAAPDRINIAESWLELQRFGEQVAYAPFDFILQ